MKTIAIILATASAFAGVAAHAQAVNSGSLANLNGSFGGGTAVTTTNANGTSTTVTGPSGGANRATATPTIGSWYQSEVGGNGTVGITNTYTNDGNGAAYFAGSSATGASKGDLAYNFAAPVLLSSLTNMSYDFYRAASSTVDANLAPVMRFNILKDGVFAGSLVLENVYQFQTPAPVGAWTNVSATLNSGIVWATNGSLGPTFADANGGQKTFADWINASANANSTLTVTGLSIGFGSGWSGDFAGAIDNVKFGFTGGPSANFDFVVNDANGAVPEPATWALMIAGFGLTGVSMRRRKASVRTKVSFV